MKNLVYIWAAWVIAWFHLSSCSKQELDVGMDENTLLLTVDCVSLKESRAESAKDGETDLNENLIKSLHYFFYHEGKTSENAVLSGVVNLAEETHDEVVVRIPMNENVLNNTLFPRPANSCEVYVIANLPAGITIPDDTSIDNLKKMVVETDFKGIYPQPSFVMDGQSTAMVIDRNKTLAASGVIPMDRLAAKMTLRVSVNESYVDVNGNEWKPITESLTVSLWNAANNTTIGGAFGDKLFNYDDRLVAQVINVEVEGTPIERHVFAPFYSYPCEWEFRSVDALAFYIILPWKCQTSDGETFQYCYYKVFPNTIQLEKNNWYNIDLNIGVLGSFEPQEEPMLIEGLTYKVVGWENGFKDWSSGLSMNAELLAAHYLVVDENEFVLNNQDECTIPFITSHACKIKDLKDEVANFTENESEVQYDDLTSQAKSGKWLVLDESTNTIKLNHPLNNNFSGSDKTYDIAPYTYTFILCHTDNEDTFYEEITIVQNPAISIEAKLNSDYPNKDGFQFVNGSSDTGADYGGAHGLTGSGNTNPNMYVIAATVLPENSDLMLGDPRSVEVHNPVDGVSAPSVENLNEKRNLTYYYPTLGDATVENMISPKFRIASSYGVTTDISHGNAINRCATYQEDGYPAGRWRVPTMGEVKFMIKLSADGKIPSLFTVNNAYWCANGAVTPLNGGGYSISKSTAGNNKPVRCVYDEWYWENSDYPRLTDKTQFTWGDKQR